MFTASWHAHKNLFSHLSRHTFWPWEVKPPDVGASLLSFLPFISSSILSLPPHLLHFLSSFCLYLSLSYYTTSFLPSPPSCQIVSFLHPHPLILHLLFFSFLFHLFFFFFLVYSTSVLIFLVSPISVPAPWHPSFLPPFLSYLLTSMPCLHTLTEGCSVLPHAAGLQRQIRSST